MGLVPQRKILAGEVDPNNLLQFSHNIEETQLGAGLGLPRKTALTSGEIDLSKAGVINKTLDNVADTASYKRLPYADSKYNLSGAETTISDLTPSASETKSSGNVSYPWWKVWTRYVILKETDLGFSGNSGYGALYTSSDNKLRFRDGAESVHEIAFVP